MRQLMGGVINIRFDGDKVCVDHQDVWANLPLYYSPSLPLPLSWPSLIDHEGWNLHC